MVGLASYKIERREDDDCDQFSTGLTKSILRIATKHITITCPRIYSLNSRQNPTKQ